MPAKLSVEEVVDRHMISINKDLVAALRDHKDKYELSMQDMCYQLDILGHKTLEKLFSGRFEGKVSTMIGLFTAMGYNVKIEILKK